jgi:hypothetical protein
LSDEEIARASEQEIQRIMEEEAARFMAEEIQQQEREEPISNYEKSKMKTAELRAKYGENPD